VAAMSASVYGRYFKYMHGNVNSVAVRFQTAWLYGKEFVN